MGISPPASWHALRLSSVKLTLLGGGGFRVPLVYGALLPTASGPAPLVDEVTLYDVDPTRLAVMGVVLRQLAEERAATRPGIGGHRIPQITLSADLDEALTGADVIFSAIRVGGAAGRTVDERVALDLGVLGQETVGPGGLAYGLRTVPIALDIAQRVLRQAPEAWVINFTNPAGLITEAMQYVLPDRVIGICDSPVGLARRAARALHLDPAETVIEYAGLNHLGWLQALQVGGDDVLPQLLADPAALATMEEGRLFGADWLAALGALPNEYLYYYYNTREALAAIRGAGPTRGEYLLAQQRTFYAAAAAEPSTALAAWRRTRAEREATYLAEARAADESRDTADLDGGGYEGVALALMTALFGGEPADLILNVRNRGALPGLPGDAVVEVPCRVGPGRVTPQPGLPLPGAMLGLVQQIKAVERLVIRAVFERDRDAALLAFAQHPLVDSVTVARSLLEGYRTRLPEVDALFR